MPQPSTIAVFLPAGPVLVIMPGPNILSIVARGVHQGRTAGVVSALPTSSATAFAVVKYAGAGYLL